MNDMTIGRAANAAGVKIDTIRYYQRIGLIAEPLGIKFLSVDLKLK